MPSINNHLLPRLLLLPILLLLSLADVSSSSSSHCHIEPNVHYSSPFNYTSLTVCPNVSRPERVCVVGAGSSGLHLAWLLSRRGFHRTTVFEARNRTGGDVFTRTPPPHPSVPSDTVTRELGTAFLSPDYDEVRALLQRFSQPVQPVSVSAEIDFHPGNWSSAWLASITGTSNATSNAATVAAAMDKYVSLHRSLFGEYDTRFPPRPPAPSMPALNATGFQFLEAHGLEVLAPFFFQFFTMQGMGLLDHMPAYYMLKWASPASLSAGGFGSASTPLAMLPKGYGALLDALVADESLDVRLNSKVSGVTRSSSGVTLSFADDGLPDEACDLLALTGPITEFVAGSLDGTRPPILKDPTPSEVSLFASKQPMQFLISLMDLSTTPDYKALEYWPAAFNATAGGEVIVRRDVGYAETNTSHAIGGVQSYSYWPAPVANRSTHWEAQQRWLAANGLKVNAVLGQNWIDTYLFHYNVEETVAGKPWQLYDIQGLGDTRTVYVGGTASFETVEDSFSSTLELVDKLIDSQIVDGLNDNQTSAQEQLQADMPCSEVDHYVSVDSQVWTAYLATLLGFQSKTTSVVDHGNGNCTVWSFIRWETRQLWKTIPAADLDRVYQQYVKAYGTTPPPVAAFPSPYGLDVLLEALPPAHPIPETTTADISPTPGQGQALEVIEWSLRRCADVARFVSADNSSMTPFLAQQKGFLRRQVLVDPTQPTFGNCTVWTRVLWDSWADWHSVPESGITKACAKFTEEMGYMPSYTRVPANGFNVTVSAGPDAGHTRIPVISGMDVVAYHGLVPGQKDVRGYPQYSVSLNASLFLSGTLLEKHPQPYVFWFQSLKNREMFAASWRQYLPAFGGHCTHGIATRNDLTPDLLVDGRVAFTCVNTTQWVVRNETVYMNSCSMYADFIKQPAQDVAVATKTWAQWFGSDLGPLNDACVQDGGRWNGRVIGALIPFQCVIN